MAPSANAGRRVRRDGSAHRRAAGEVGSVSSVSPGTAELGSVAQRNRRRRILDATIATASRGGFDAVQMRTVAERADVALGTLYRYFPSKIHLLVSTLAQQFEQTQEKLDRRPVPGATPAERVTYVLTRATRGMQREPHLTEAMTRAFMFADSSAADEIHVVGMQLTTMLAKAIHGPDYVEGAPLADDDIAVTRVISDVWLSTLVSWVTGRMTTDEVAEHLTAAVRLLLG
ncbi:MAG: TetR family transcriptional regulator [Marmoricola sp.]